MHREQFPCVIQRDLYFLSSPPLSSAVSESKETSLILSHCSQYSTLNLNHKADYFKNKAAVVLNKGKREAHFYSYHYSVSEICSTVRQDVLISVCHLNWNEKMKSWFFNTWRISDWSVTMKQYIYTPTPQLFSSIYSHAFTGFLFYFYI